MAVNALTLPDATKAKRKKGLPVVSPAVILISIIGIIGFLMIPGQISLHERHKFLMTAKHDNQQARTLEEQTSAGQQVAASYKQWIAKEQTYKAAVPVVETIPQVIKLLTNATVRTGVTWQSGSTTASSSSAAGAPPGTASIPISMSITGSLANDQRFVAYLQSLPTVFVVNSVTYSSQGGTAGGGVAASINVETFVATSASVTANNLGGKGAPPGPPGANGTSSSGSVAGHS